MAAGGAVPQTTTVAMGLPRADGHAGRKIHVDIRKLMNVACVYQIAVGSDPAVPDEDCGPCRDPAQYDWSDIGVQEMLVPYNCAMPHFNLLRSVGQAAFMKSQHLRWESHRVRIVEGALCRGESNVIARRRFYIDEESGLILLGEAYDIAGRMVTCYVLDSYMVSQRPAPGRWYRL